TETHCSPGLVEMSSSAVLRQSRRSTNALSSRQLEETMRCISLDFLFGREAAVYSSLTFQYSTMQALHRDAPYFHTFPEGQFVGVWTVLLEDIHPDSGPLSYVQGSHRFRIDQRALYRDALSHTRDPAGAPSRSRENIAADHRASEIGPRAYAVLEA